MVVGVIYTIINLVNGKQCIGSTIRPRTRGRDHFRQLRNRRHDNPLLQYAWDKYGEENFSYKILEVDIPEPKLRATEQEWIEKLRTHEAKFGYNCQYPVKRHAPSKRMTKAHKSYWSSLTPAKKAKRIAHLKSREVQDRATAGKQSAEHKELKRQRALEQWSDPSYNQKRNELRIRMKGFHTDPSVCAKISQKAIKRWKDKAYREWGLKQLNEIRPLAAAAKKQATQA